MRALIRRAGIVRVEDLRKDLKVSVATVRRDLEAMEDEGRVRRVHGGAISMRVAWMRRVLIPRPALPRRRSD